VMVEPFPRDLAAALKANDIGSRLLIIADDADLDGSREMAAAAGLRLLGVVSLDHARSRLAMQVECDIILLIVENVSIELAQHITAVETIALENNIAIILLTSLETLDDTFAAVRSPRTQILCAPDGIDLATALLSAAQSNSPPRHFHDAARENEKTTLNRLSEEVGRLARTIEALADRQTVRPSFPLSPRISDRPSDYIGLSAHRQPKSQPLHHSVTDLTASQVRDVLRARRSRSDFLPGDLFADPAWDMLLDLLAARLDQTRVSVSSLCIASCVPPTTALRWIRTLADKRLIDRQPDPHDSRRIFVVLTDRAADMLAGWFHASRPFLNV
jgi:hypothetical protein